MSRRDYPIVSSVVNINKSYRIQVEIPNISSLALKEIDNVRSYNLSPYFHFDAK